MHERGRMKGDSFNDYETTVKVIGNQEVSYLRGVVKLFGRP